MAKMQVWARVGMSFTLEAENKNELEHEVKRLLHDVQQTIRAAGLPIAIDGETYIPMDDDNELLSDEIEIMSNYDRL